MGATPTYTIPLFQLPEVYNVVARLVVQLKYGENGWQKPAGLYAEVDDDPLALHRFEHVEGRSPGYVNLTDMDRLLQTMTHIAAVREANGLPVDCISGGVKHGNGSGFSISTNGVESLGSMVMGNRTAVFGGLVMTNFALFEDEARVLRRYGLNDDAPARILDGVFAPHLSHDARGVLRRKEGACIMMQNPALQKLGILSLDTRPRDRFVRGGRLVQPNYCFLLTKDHPEITVYPYGPEPKWEDILLAWSVGSTSNSNTISIVNNGMLIGLGVSGMDRVWAAQSAIRLAGREGHQHLLVGATGYSDSFFPFDDALRTLAEAGVRVIFTSSGSRNDERVIAAALDLGVTLIMLPDSLCRGFFNH